MGASQREAQRILESKRKYFQKVLSDDAIDFNLIRTYSIFDLASFWGDWVLSDTLFSSLIGLLLFDLPLADIVPWNVMWEIELPSVDEFLRGVLIKLEPIQITVPYPELSDVSRTLEKIVTPEFRVNIEETRPRKLKVGITKYGEGYVDPPAVREFLRSTLYAFTKKDISWSEVKQRLQAVAKTLNIAPEIVEDLFNRLSIMTAIKERAATWDYAWWDVSYWSEEGSSGYVEFTNWDLKSDKVEYEQLWDVQAGAWWDLSYWDWAYWTDDVSPWEVNPDTRVAYISEMRDYVVDNFRRRVTITALAAGNYQRARERRYPYRSSRLETYAMPFSQRLRLESIVERIVKRLKPDVPPFQLRLYKTAVIEMYAKLYSSHIWGAEMERSMSADEYRAFWLEKWGSEGLDRSILEKLYDYVRSVVDALGSVRVRERTRFIRWRLRRY
ncbi:MAG: hypothetical protein DRJ96_05315 [Thermoprotei archaeon]|nr:MAG: hypothetical protein DRJ96_05315 [Thermoprotei archaeon]